MTRTTTFRATAIVGGFLLAILMIMTVSRAAFTAETDNGGNTWSAGTLNLTNDKVGEVLFEVPEIAPGDSGWKCIEIIHSGLDADVALSGIATGGTGLQHLLDVTITRYAGGDCNSGTSYDVYDGKLSAFPGSTPEPLWDTSVLGSTQHYKIAWSLPASTGNSAQGDTGLARFTWQATSN
jgi:hypothetical protein